eukprot:2272708-Amphidinium_carterae.1
MVKAVPGFLQVSDLWQWVISNAVALFSGPTVCGQRAFNVPSNHTPSSRLNKMSPPRIALNKLQVAYNNTRGVSLAHLMMDVCIGRSFKCRLLTSFGLDLLAGKLFGPKIDRATLQLIGVLFASILLP